jgi:hypothetical protein
MTGVMLGQSVVPVFLFTVHGHVRPIGGNGRRGEAPRDSLPCQRTPRVPRARQKYAKRVRRSVLTLQESDALMTSWGLDEVEGILKPRAI